jgi:hypothetical protein
MPMSGSEFASHVFFDRRGIVREMKVTGGVWPFFNVLFLIPSLISFVAQAISLWHAGTFDNGAWRVSSVLSWSCIGFSFLFGAGATIPICMRSGPDGRVWRVLLSPFILVVSLMAFLSLALQSIPNGPGLTQLLDPAIWIPIGIFILIAVNGLLLRLRPTVADLTPLENPPPTPEMAQPTELVRRNNDAETAGIDTKHSVHTSSVCVCQRSASHSISIGLPLTSPIGTPNGLCLCARASLPPSAISAMIGRSTTGVATSSPTASQPTTSSHLMPGSVTSEPVTAGHVISGRMTFDPTSQDSGPEMMSGRDAFHPETARLQRGLQPFGFDTDVRRCGRCWCGMRLYVDTGPGIVSGYEPVMASEAHGGRDASVISITNDDRGATHSLYAAIASGVLASLGVLLTRLCFVDTAVLWATPFLVYAIWAVQVSSAVVTCPQTYRVGWLRMQSRMQHTISLLPIICPINHHLHDQPQRSTQFTLNA